MKLAFVLPLLALATTASAKITQFKSQDALQSLLASDSVKSALKKMQAGSANLTKADIKISHNTPTGMPAFQLRLTLEDTSLQDAPKRICYVAANVFVVLTKEQLPNGSQVVSSELGEPQLLEPVNCTGGL
jgi:hypothetical protein